MECKENYRRLMAAFVRKVYDNDRNIIHIGLRPRVLDYQAYREIRHWLTAMFIFSVKTCVNHGML
jgi:hypothetical protein